MSGIYPHLATFNDGGTARYGECGIGAVVPWAGSLWYMTYPPHERRGSADKLYQVDGALNLTVRSESVGGTHAGRMIHRESKQLVMGPYFIDEMGRVRAVDVRRALPGRITALTRHLTDPANKVYAFDMEGPIWEIDVQTLAPRRLFVKPVPGWHGKGAYTAQGRLIIANNGERRAADLDSLTWELPESTWSRGPEDAGALAELDGQAWTVVSRRQHTDVTGPGGLSGEPSPDAPVWAMGWDKRSVMLQVRDRAAAAAGRNPWSTYRVLKASYTYDPKHGWFTEWPRIREIGGGRFLMNMHGGFFDFPAGLRPGQTGGLRPLSSHLDYLADFTEWNGWVVLAADDTSVVSNALGTKSQSNLRFVKREQLATEFGPAVGFGGLWVRDPVKANTPSEPLLVGGYERRTLHLAHDGAEELTFVLETDDRGDGQFRAWQRVSVPARGYTAYVLPPDGAPLWLRLRAERDATVTAYVHAGSSPAPAGDAGLGALDPIERPTGAARSIVRPAGFSRDLQFLARAGGVDAYYEVDQQLRVRRVEAPEKVTDLSTAGALAADFEVDAASVIVRRGAGRWRLPKGRAGAFDATAGLLRGLREVTSERFLANYHGTFYEIPRLGTEAVPDFARMKPVASHGARISDFCSWRGLLVLSGVAGDAPASGHVFRAAPGAPGLWLGAVDDLWRLGRPVGEGGPWRDTEVQANAPSDPYLMTAYGKKNVSLSHSAAAPVTFMLEVDVLADGTWFLYRQITVEPGQTARHEFPEGFGAHWIRARVDRATRATAILRYE